MMAALEEKFNDFKEETTSSIKSFADAVKVSAPNPPSNTPPPPPKPIRSTPPVKRELLPQAVVRYYDHVNVEIRPSFAELVPRLNSSLRDHPKFSLIHVVGVKWTAASNLLVRAQAPSPSVLVDALEAVMMDLKGGMAMRVKDIIPNARWSRVTLSHVFTGKGPDLPAHGPNDIHEELTAHNPNYASLTIRQPPSWVRDPTTYKEGQVSSVTFAFKDPDGSHARWLIGSSLTAFGNLRCTVKAWVTPKKKQKA